MSEQKPREFQIYKTVGDDDTIWSAVEDSGEYETSIHVIEKSAFDALAKENASLKKAIEGSIENAHETVTMMSEENTALKDENEQLRSEVWRQEEKLIAIAKDRDALKDEAERLKGESIDMLSIAGQEHITRTMAQAEIRSLKAEVEFYKNVNAEHVKAVKLEREETAALKAENERLAIKLHECNMSLPMSNTGWPHEKILHEQLTRERSITAMLREVLEAIAKPIPDSIHTSEVEIEQTAAAQRALARENEMRK